MMGIFTAGNLITLGITFFIILIVRYLDRHTRSVKLAREYGKKLKEDFAAFADEKAAEVKDNGLILDVQKSAVKEALNRLVQANAGLTEKTLAITQRFEEVSQIGDRISAYDKSMEELIRMTSRVEDTISRLREETVFVEETAKKISGIQKQAGELEKGIGNLEFRFERDNTAALEKAVENLMSGVEGSVVDLQSAVKMVEQQVEDHRAAVDRIEAERKSLLERDVAIINNTLEDALEKAAGRSNQFEEAALVKLKEEALLRINRFKDTVEAKISEYHENARGKIAEIEELVKACRNEWNTGHEEMEVKQRNFYEQLTAEQEVKVNEYNEDARGKIAEIEEQVKACMDEWNAGHEEIEAKQRDFYEQFIAEQETKISGYHENASGKIAEIEEQVKACMDEWNAGHEEIEAKQRNFYEQLTAEQEAKISEYHKTIMEIEELVKTCRNEWNAEHEERDIKQRDFYERLIAEQEAKISEYRESARGVIAEIEELVKSCRNEWNAGHEEMNAKQRDFYEQFGSEQEKFKAGWQRDIEVQDALALSQRKQWERAVAEAEERLGRLESEINVKITRVEETLLMELDRRLEAYREGETVQWKRLETAADDALKLDSQLRLVMEEAETRVRRDFSHFEEDQKGERDRIGAALFESAENYKAQMVALEQELNTLKNRAYDNVSEKLKIFEDDFFADLARRSTEVDKHLAEWNSNLEQKLGSMAEEGEMERRNLELSFKEELSARMEEQKERVLSELERLKLKADAFEEKIQNGLDETENRISSLSGSLEAVGRGLKDFTAQTRLFEKTDELKLNLEHSIETLKAELSGIEDRRAEAARLETEFIKIRRLEDEVNTKMTRFLTERNHLDIMEKDFDRLIQTSLRVEDRLKEVTGSDDTLQNLQVSLRKLEDAIAAAEDKYQRVESKNRILEETNRGIERNFQILEEIELALRKCRENIDRTEEDLDSFRPSIEELAAASEKARDAEKKLITLDTGLSAIETRIEKMQVAREWLARAETRFEELNREAQEELKLLEAVLKDESKKSGSSGKGSPPTSVRENVIRLARQGWGPEEIARTLKIGRGEVELLLETPGLR